MIIGQVLTWTAFALALGLFGARAWVVETNRGRLSTAGTAQRALTWAVSASVVLLIVMAALNGGLTLAGLLINGETPVATTQPDNAPVAPQPLAPVGPGAAAPGN